MKRIKQSINDIIKIYKTYFFYIVITLGILINISTLFSVGSFLISNNEHQTIIFSGDNDAGRGITTSQRTAWYKSNHFHPYGNLYFRIAHTLQAFAPNELNEENLNPQEMNEKSHHQALLLTSLISIFLLVASILFIISKDLIVTLFLIPIFLNILLQNQVWSVFLLRVHPDHLLGFFIAIATYFFYQLTKYPESKKYFVISAIFFGLAAGVKSFAIVFGLPIAIIFLMEKKLLKLKVQKIFQFALLIFISYQVIGFPQNISIWKTLEFLKFNSRLTLAPDIGSVLDWFHIFFQQAKFSVPTLIVLALFFGEKDKNSKINNSHHKILFFSLIAPLILLTGKHTYPHNHYAIPFIASFLVALGIWISNMTPNIFRTSKQRYIAIIIFLFSFKYIIGFDYKVLNSELRKQKFCRNEVKDVWKKIRTLQKEGKFIMADPYTPSAIEYNHLRKSYWGLDWNKISKHPETQVILLRRNYFSRYYQPPSLDPKPEDKARWIDIEKFYRALDKNKTSIDPKGHSWKKTHDDKCGLIIWEKSV